MQSLPTCGLAKVETMAKLWGDKTLICTLEGSCNQRTVMKEEPPELFSRSKSKMPTGSWSVKHHHIFNSSSAFLKSFQPSLWSRGKSSENACTERKKHEMSKWRPAKKGIGRPITRCHCDFCDLWKRAQHGKHRFPILRGRNKLTKYSISHQR